MKINTIRDLVLAVQDNNVILPAIQRNYVWGKDQIYGLFDSLMQEYPIGEMLIWDIGAKEVNSGGISFYKFLTEYERDVDTANETISTVKRDKEMLAVLDGQQRIQSLVLGLIGSYTDSVKKGKKYLYLNLVERERDLMDDDTSKYEFKFLTEREVSALNEENPEDNKWFLVGNVIKFDGVADIRKELDKFTFGDAEIRAKAKEMLKLLMNAINEEKNSKNKRILNFYVIERERPFNEVLEMFIRKNNGGTELSKTDLLFSNVVLEWPEAKKTIKEFLKRVNTNNSTKCFYFNIDFIMRTALYLFSKEIKMEVSKFKSISTKIKDNWNKIDDAITKTAKLLLQIGFAGDNITSYNAVIPIIYYVYNGGKLEKKNKKEIRKYLIVAQLKKLFGASANTTLTKTRDALKGVKDFELKVFSGVTLTGDKDFKVDKDVVQKWLKYKKGKYTFMVLTILYPNVNVEFGRSFHQDHLHSEALLKKAGYGEERNLLANLQLIAQAPNQEKSKKTLEEWMREGNDFDYHPKGISIDIKDYREFIEKRGELMVDKLVEELK